MERGLRSAASLHAKYCGELNLFVFNVLQVSATEHSAFSSIRRALTPTEAPPALRCKCNSRFQCVANRVVGFMGDLIREKACETANSGSVVEECVGRNGVLLVLVLCPLLVRKPINLTNNSPAIHTLNCEHGVHAYNKKQLPFFVEEPVDDSREAEARTLRNAYSLQYLLATLLLHVRMSRVRQTLSGARLRGRQLNRRGYAAAPQVHWHSYGKTDLNASSCA